MQVETPVAIVDRNIDRRPANSREKTRSCAEAFVEYLFTPEAQKEFAACGFRYRGSVYSNVGVPQSKRDNACEHIAHALSGAALYKETPESIVD